MTVCFRCNNECHDGANFCHVCGSSLEKGDIKIISSSDPLVGRVLADRYRIISLIGRGGMGVVYRGEHIHMAKPVALKLLSGEVAAQKDLTKRFKREADAASRLNNIHTVTIFDFGQSQGLIYLVMEYLQGNDLAVGIRKVKKFSTLKALMVLAQVCESLAEAHELNVIHRDLKPENIFLIERKRTSDFVKVLDFGLAKIRAELEAPDETAHGVVLGTPYYMAPEQIRGELVDNRSDIYSMGGLLYTMISGHPPFMAPTPLAVMAMHLTNAVPALDVPKGFNEDEKQKLTLIVGKCMNKDPEKRYSDVNKLKDDVIAAAGEVASGEFTIPGTIKALPGADDTISTTPTDISTAGLKEDFDRYEKILRIRRIAYFIVPLLLLAVAGAGAYRFLSNYSVQQGPDILEKEPNNSPLQANVLPLGTKRCGTIGKRISAIESDHDWYEINVKRKNRLLDVTLDGIPSMNLILQVFEQGNEKALATASGFGTGDGEIIRSLDVRPNTYFILIREDLSILGMRASESISDFYSITASTCPAGEWEVEPNGTLESATKVSGSGRKKGTLQGAADTDYYHVNCDGPGGLNVLVSGTDKLSLVLSVLDVMAGPVMNICGKSPRLEISPDMEMEKFYVSLRHLQQGETVPGLEDFNRTYTIEFLCIPYGM